jgi:hypothetical protein
MSREGIDARLTWNRLSKPIWIWWNRPNFYALVHDFDWPEL